MFFYSKDTSTPSFTPPSDSALRFWLDATELTVADGTAITTMNNKGTLGGTFIKRTDISIDTNANPTVDTVDGKKALSWAANETHGLISTQAMSYNQPITILTLTRNEANQTSGVPNGAPYSNSGRHLDLGYGRLQLVNNQGWDSYPSFYSSAWRIDPGSPPGGGIDIDMGTVSAVLIQYDITLSTTTKFFKIKKDAADTIATFTPAFGGIGGIPISSSPMLIGGLYGSAGGGGYINSFAGKMFEIMIWEGTVDDAAVRTYLGQKYGGTW